MSLLLLDRATVALPGTPEGTEQAFARLAAQWHKDTDHLSSPSRIRDHDAYLKILTFGRAAIPLILEDLKQRGGDWYKALRILTDTNPILPEHQGIPRLMDDDWIKWGQKSGLIE